MLTARDACQDRELKQELILGSLADHQDKMLLWGSRSSDCKKMSSRVNSSVRVLMIIPRTDKSYLLRQFLPSPLPLYGWPLLGEQFTVCQLLFVYKFLALRSLGWWELCIHFVGLLSGRWVFFLVCSVHPLSQWLIVGFVPSAWALLSDT